MEIKKEQTRLDKLDTKADKKISTIKGKEGELTQVYIKKVDALKDSLAVLPPAKRSEVMATLFNELKQINVANIETKESAFNTKVNKFIDTVNKKKEVKAVIDRLAGSGWTELGAGNIFNTLYANLTAQGLDIQKNQAENLTGYIEASSKIAETYRENIAYFLEDRKPGPNDDPTLKLYINDRIASGILTGKVPETGALIKEFSKITDQVKEKKTQCQGLEKVMGEMAFGKEAQNLAADRGKIIELYATLVEKHQIPIKTISTVLKKVVYSEEFSQIAETGWDSTEEFKNFVIETVLRGGAKGKIDQNEIKIIQAELRIKQDYLRERAVINQEIENLNSKAEVYQNEIQEFKTNFTRDGQLYKYCLLDKEISSSDPDGNRGNFAVLMQAERNFAVIKANRTLARVKQAGNEAKYLSEIAAIHEATPVSTLDSEIAQLRAQHKIETNEADEKSAITKHKNLLKGELIYRQMLEGGAPIDNEVVKNAVVARKETGIKVLSDSIQQIQRQIQQNVGPVENAIARYGKLNLVPADQKLILLNQTKQLLHLLEISNQYISRTKGLDIEIKLLKSDAGLTPETKNSLDDQSNEQKELFAKAGEFITGKEENLPDPDISGPEVQAMMLGRLREPIGAKIGSSIDGLVNAAQDVTHYFESQVNSKIVKQLSGSYIDLLNMGITKTDKMISAIQQGRASLNVAKADLQKALNSEEGLIKNHPELVKARKELIGGLIKGIDNLLHGEFSVAQEAEVFKVRAKLEEVKEDMFWDVVKFAITFALSVGAALVTGGLFAAGAGRLFSVVRVGERVHKIATFAGGNIGVALGSTVGQRLATHVANEVTMGTDWKVDWSAESLVSDFGKSLGRSLAFTGAGALGGRRLAMNASIKTGGEFTYADLAEAGITKLGFIQRLMNPLLRKEGASARGQKFVEEVTEEAGQELGNAIDPRLGVITSLLSATKSPNVNVKTRSRVKSGLQNLGVTFNSDLKRLELSPTLSAKDFGINLLETLGESAAAVDSQINADNSISLRIKGTEEEFVIHPSDERLENSGKTEEKAVEEFSSPPPKSEVVEVKNEDAQIILGISKTRIKNEISEYIQNLQAERETHTEIAEVLNRLKQRDPGGHELLLNSDIDRLVDLEIFDGIIQGEKVEFTDDVTGEKITSYVGKFVNEGGMGKIFHVGYVSGRNNSLQFAVIKKPHAGKEHVFIEEAAAQEEIQSWNSEYLIKPLQINEKYIIYETAEKTMDMRQATTVLQPPQYFRLLKESINGVREYQQRAMFHSDIKNSNILLLKTGIDEKGDDVYSAKIIDNSALPAGDIFHGFATTPDYGYRPEILIKMRQFLVSRGNSSDEAAVMAAQAFDTKCIATTIEKSLKAYGIQLNPDHNLAMLLKDINDDPLVASRESTLKDLQFELEELANELENKQ